MDAEAMLFIDDYQRQRTEFNALLEQGMGADHDGRVTLADSGEGRGAPFSRLSAGQQSHGNAKGLEPTPEILRVLIRKQLGRRHQRHLTANLYCLRSGYRCHQRLSATDVALYQAQHGFCDVEVLLYLTQHSSLCGRQLKR